MFAGFAPHRRLKEKKQQTQHHGGIVGASVANPPTETDDDHQTQQSFDQHEQYPESNPASISSSVDGPKPETGCADKSTVVEEKIIRRCWFEGMLDKMLF